MNMNMSGNCWQMQPACGNRQPKRGELRSPAPFGPHPHAYRCAPRCLWSAGEERPAQVVVVQLMLVAVRAGSCRPPGPRAARREGEGGGIAAT